MVVSNEDKLLCRHFQELAERSYASGKYTYTSFLGLHETVLLLQMGRDLQYAGVTLYGGFADSERCIARFGSDENCGYAEPFPIAFLEAKPAQKFADTLTHRDILGALMHLGLERNAIGDILLADNTAYIAVLSRFVPLLLEELTKAKHTTLRCSVIDTLPDGLRVNEPEATVQVSSERLDVLVAAVFKLSRENAAALFRQEKVFCNGQITEGSRTAPKDAVISVRGFGRFRYGGVQSRSRKNKYNCLVFLFQ